MLAMACLFPLFSISAHSAARQIPSPDTRLMSFRGAIPAAIVAGIDISTLLLGCRAFNQIQKLTQTPNALVASNKETLETETLKTETVKTEILETETTKKAPSQITPASDQQQSPDPATKVLLNHTLRASKALLKTLLCVTPCSVATTVVGNYFDRRTTALNGLSRTLINNLGFLFALETAAREKPGQNRLRVATALLCATLSGLHNGFAMGRGLPNAKVAQYMLSNAFATLIFQMAFEAIRYPIHAKQYRQSCEK
jgi:hypothetical protein